MRNYYGGYSHSPGYAESDVYGEPVYDGFGYPVGEAVYDGLGNALGFSIPGLSSIVRGVSNLIPGAASLATKLLPGLIPGAAAAGALQALFPGAPSPAPASPGAPGFPMQALPQPGMPFQPFRRPLPAGWAHPQLPYTGLGPKRLYMRCAVWPGPRGLVPAYAQGAAAQAQAALQQTAQMAQMAAQRGAATRRRHHGHRRR